MRLLLTLLLLAFISGVFSQNIAGFSDYQNKFYVFDDGNIRQLEYQPVKEFEVGDKCLAYVTNGDHFKAYYNHITYDISLLVSSYKVTDNLITYQIGTQLYVFEDGVKRLLSKFVGNYLAGDSLVVFFDTENYYFQAYYNGKIIYLEDGLLFANAAFFKVGANILGYIDAYQNFKVFYQGKTYELEQTPNIIAKLGRNIMAYIDPMTGFLKVFYEGEVFEQETFKPKSFQVGYEKVAYVTNMGDFKLFDNGETYDIASYKPDFYELKDEMLVYHLQNQLFAFYKGEQYLIESFIPASYEISDNTIAYLNQNGFLKLFQNGEVITLSYEKINEYKVHRNVVIYNEGMNTTKIYYNGKTYTP
ncbi:MAG: hypothetical protein PF517_16355 [Salinivirgaceae bacterium]|jgi:hypothetical protein|nr:hypothetical protein [Salinivirgaceae bacterium]